MVVDIGRADHITQSLLEEVSLLVGDARRADAADGLRAMRLENLRQASANEEKCLIPTGGLQLAVATNERRAQAVVVDKAKFPAPAIAQPAIVDLVVVARHQAHDLVNAHVHTSIAADAAIVADAGRVLQLPRARPEAIGAGSERADRADFDRVAGEDGVEGAIRGSANLHLVATRDHYEAIVHRNLRTETRAALAENAALAVKQDVVADGNGLGVVALVLIEARATGAVALRKVLQIALTGLVTDGAIERVVDEQKFQRAAPRLQHLLGVGMHDHALADGRGAGGLRRLRHLLDLHEAHTARA